MGWLQNIRKVIPPGPAGNHDSARDLNEKPGNENDDVLLEELPGVLQSLKDSTSKFNDLAQEQKMGVIQQSSSLHQVAVTSEEISAAAKSISQSADSVEQSALRSIAGCKRGQETLEEAGRNMDIASGQVESLVENIRELEAHNRQISGIASIINEITDQLNLMALNAQIEAAGAGAYGRRFSVVAEEVKRLADNSRTSTASIQKIIKNVLGNVSALVDSAQLSLDATRRSLENMNAVGADLAAIDGEISRTHVLTREIKVSTHQQSTAQQELTQALAEVDSVTFSNAEKMTRQVEGAVTDLSDIAQYLTMTLETIIPKTPENEDLDAITLEPGAGQSKNDGSD